MKTNRESLRLRGALCTALMLLFTLQQASADTISNWTGNSSVNWNDSGNWDSGVPNSTSFTAVIPGTSTASTQPTLNVGETIDNLTLSAATSVLTFGSGITLTMNSGGTISNAGTVSVGSGTISLLGPTGLTISGAGTLNLAGGAIYTTSSNQTTLANSSTITGRGIIGGNGGYGFNITNTGTINGNDSAGTLTLQNGLTITNTSGTLEATNNGNLQLYQNTVSGGNITASGGGTVTLNDATVNGSTLNTTGGTMNATANSSLEGSVGLTGTLNVLDGQILSLNAGSGGVTLTGGTLNVGSSTGAYLYLTNSGGAVTFQGGTVQLNSSNIAPQSNNNGTVNNGVNGVTTGIIQGSGNIGYFPMILNNAAGSVINANQNAKTLNIGYNLDTVNNYGTLEATSGGILGFSSATIANTDGTILANGGTVNLLSGVQVTGGTLQTENSGVMNLGGSAQLIGSVTIATGSTVNIGSASATQAIFNAGSTGMTLTNNGSLVVGSGSSIYLEDAGVPPGQTVTLNGTGSLTLSGGNIQAQSSDGPIGMTLAAQQTIQGSGTIGYFDMSITNGTSSASNVINANSSGNTLQLGYNLDTINNTYGTLEASNGGTLFLEYAHVTGGTILSTGTGSIVNITTGSDVLNNLTLQTQSSGVMNLGGSATLEGTITIATGSTVNVGPPTTSVGNTQVILQGGTTGMTLTNNGSLVVGPSSVIDMEDNGSVGTTLTLNGTGSLTLAGGNIQPVSADGMTLAAQQTIQGYGTIGYYPMTIINGTSSASNVINANVSGQTLQLGYNLDTINNTYGTLEATNGGILYIEDANVTGGTILAAAGSTVNITTGSDTVSGGILQTQGNGIMNIGAATLEGTETIATGSTVNVAQATGAAATTYIYGGTTGMDLIDNGSLVVGSGSILNLQDNGSTGTTITLDGTGNITLSGGAIENTSSDGMKLVNNATIQGGGTIGYYGLTVTNNGLILANDTAAPMNFIAADTLTNGSTGILQTALNSTMTVNGTLTNFSGTTLTGGTYINAGLFEFVGADIVTNQATIIMDSAAGAIENINNSANALVGHFTNNGGSGGAGVFTVRNGANYSTNGGGVLTFTNASNGTMNAGDLSSITSGNGSTLTFNTATQSNAGSINAINQGTVAISSALTNTGSINAGNASAGAVSNVNITAGITNTGGSVNALFDGIVNVTSAIITGGAVTTVSGGVVNLSGGQLSGVAVTNAGTLNAVTNTTDVISGTISNTGTIAVADKANLNIGGVTTFTNNGNITLNAATGQSTLNVGSSTVTVTGTGDINLSNNAGNLITGSSGGVFVNSGNTIQGSGNIGNAAIGFSNSGTVTANQSTPLFINAVGAVTNTGTLQANTGGTLTLESNITNTSGNVTAGFGSTAGTVNVNGVTITGGTVSTTSNGIINLSTGTITGGTVNNVGTINTVATTGSTLSGSSITNSGNVNVVDSSALTISSTAVSGAFTNSGNINLQSTGDATTLSVSGTVTLSGGGTIALSNHSQNNISGSGTLVNTDNTIEGAGSVSATLNNQSGGTINANASAGMTISGTFTNTGTVDVGSGDVLDVNGSAGSFTNFSGGTLTGGTYSISGTFEFTGDNTGFATNASNITLSGAGASIKDTTGTLNGLADLSGNTGTLDVTGGASATTAAGLTNSGSGSILVGTGSELSGSGTFNMTGGTLEVDGTGVLNYATAVNFNGGTVTGNGTIDPASIDNISGILDPAFAGAPATLNFGAPLILGSGGTVDLDLGASTNSELAVTGAVTLGGTLEFTELGGFTPSVEQLVLMTATGGFTNGIPTSWNSDVPSASGYTFGLGFADGGDELVLNITSSTGTSGPPPPSTPEPSTWTTLGLGLAAAFIANKKRRSARASR